MLSISYQNGLILYGAFPYTQFRDSRRVARRKYMELNKLSYRFSTSSSTSINNDVVVVVVLVVA